MNIKADRPRRNASQANCDRSIEAELRVLPVVPVFAEANWRCARCGHSTYFLPSRRPGQVRKEMTCGNSLCPEKGKRLLEPQFYATVLAQIEETD